MIDPMHFLESLESSGIHFVTGVPDSLLKDVCACITEHLPKQRHIIAANEGNAVGMAIGYYLASGRPALVYLQNSGLGNIINPVTSLADPNVYAIPMIFMIGWRGEIFADGRQIHDEPQHIKQGWITRNQLEILDIPYREVDSSTNITELIAELTNLALTKSGPVAMLVRRQAFLPYRFDDVRSERNLITREASIQTVIACLPDDLPIVSTTGMISRELFAFRVADGNGHHRDFLTVGGMGHASQIATGIALVRDDKKVVCLDGDAALLMHMGGLTISSERSNLLHIVLNNGAHDSVGGQPSKALGLSLTKIANSCGYGLVKQAKDIKGIEECIQSMLQAPCSCFLEIICKRGFRPGLGRPNRSSAENKLDFMRFLNGEKSER